MHGSWLVAALAGAVWGCAPAAPPDPPPLFVPAEMLQWRTHGGGQLSFDVRRGEAGNFEIEITERQFRPAAHRLTLTRQASLPVYDLVERVFAGKVNVAGIVTPENAPTGTWTHVFVVDREGQQIEITNSSVVGDLHALRYWVEDQLPPLEAEGSPLMPE